MSTLKLKPCPFCGKVVMYIPASVNPTRFAVAMCQTDGCTAQKIYFDGNEKWNTRPREAELEARVKELEAANKTLRGCVTNALEVLSETDALRDLAESHVKALVEAGEDLYTRLSYSECEDDEYDLNGEAMEFWRKAVKEAQG